MSLARPNLDNKGSLPSLFPLEDAVIGLAE